MTDQDKQLDIWLTTEQAEGMFAAQSGEKKVKELVKILIQHLEEAGADCAGLPVERLNE